MRALTNMLAITQDPETQQVLGAMIMMNMEGEGVTDVRDYFRKKLLRLGVLTPTDEEAQELMQEAQNTPPDPNAVFLEASAQEAQAKAGLAKANTLLTVAKSKESEAKTVETLANVDIADRDQLLRTVQALSEGMQPSGETPPSPLGAQ